MAFIEKEIAPPVADNPVNSPLAYTPEVAREMAPLYEKVKDVVPPVEWPQMAPLIKEPMSRMRTKKLSS